MVHVKQLAVLAAIATLAQAQPSLYPRYAAIDPWQAKFNALQKAGPAGAVPKPKDSVNSLEAKLKKEQGLLAATQKKMYGLQGMNKKLSATDQAQDKVNRGQAWRIKKLSATDRAEDKQNRKLTGELNAAQGKLRKPIGRKKLDPWKAKYQGLLKTDQTKLAAKSKAGKRSIENDLYARDLYEREAYADAMPEPAFDDNEYVNSGLYARDLYERDLYERDLMEGDLHEREAEAEAYPEDYSPLGARDLDHINNILARDPEALTERDIEALASTLTDRDLHELYTRSAEPEPADFEHELFAREAEAEAEAEADAEAEANAEAEAEAEAHELFAREAEAEAEPEADADNDNLNFERDIPVVDMVKRMLGYQRE